MNSKIQKLFFVSTLLFFAGGFMSFSPNNQFTGKEVSEMGGAYLQFAGKFGGEVTQRDLRNTNEITVDGCAHGSKIFQFTLEITKRGKTITHKGMTYKLTKDIRSDLRSLSAGDEFVFKKVKAHLPDGKSVVYVWGKKYTVV